MTYKMRVKRVANNNGGGLDYIVENIEKYTDAEEMARLAGQTLILADYSVTQWYNSEILMRKGDRKFEIKIEEEE